MRELVYTESYVRRAKKFFRKHPELLSSYEKCLKLVRLNPTHPSLRLHPLKGKLKELHSISINISYRITIELILERERIILVSVGDYGDVY